MSFTARHEVLDDGRIAVRSPAVGLYREAPATGAVVQVGEAIGRIEVLGVLHPVRAPASGAVVAQDGRARRPVAYGELLFVLDPRIAGVAAARAETKREASGLVFRAPMAGRFYLRPAPGEAPFVAEGQELAAGQTLGLLEVMKTFNRVIYGGEGLPPRARVVRVLAADQDEVAAGQPLLELAAS